MNLRFSSSVIFVKNIERSKAFYCQLLGQKVKHDFGKNVEIHGGFTLWEIRSKHIIPEKLGIDAIETKTFNRFELYFEFDDIETIARELKNAGVEFLHDVHEEPWGQRTIRFFDPDRHLIEVGETLQYFVNRLSKKYRSVSSVSDKTGIPESTIRELINYE